VACAGGHGAGRLGTAGAAVGVGAVVVGCGTGSGCGCAVTAHIRAVMARARQGLVAVDGKKPRCRC
jgi:hypothetical protein